MTSKTSKATWICPKCGQPADAHNRGVSCETLAAIRCPICKAVNDHTLSCPTRWYSAA